MLEMKAQNKRNLAYKKRRVTRAVFITHRFINEWVLKKLKEDGWNDIRPEHLRLISIISAERININELSQRAHVTKQAMSKMVNNLINRGFITFEADTNDSRAKIISITTEGAEFMDYVMGWNKLVEERLKSIIGHRKTQQLISLMSDLAESILDMEKKERTKLTIGKQHAKKLNSV